MESNNGDDWKSWRRAILRELEQHNATLDRLTIDGIKMRENLIVLKIYAALGGALAGIITTLIVHKIVLGI